MAVMCNTTAEELIDACAFSVHIVHQDQLLTCTCVLKWRAPPRCSCPFSEDTCIMLVKVWMHRCSYFLQLLLDSGDDEYVFPAGVALSYKESDEFANWAKGLLTAAVKARIVKIRSLRPR